MVKNNPKMKDITHRFGEIAIAPASVSVYNLQVEECNYYKDRFSGVTAAWHHKKWNKLWCMR